MRVFYLHGFASSAQSSKAHFFAERLASLGVPLDCPDFNRPDFSTLTTTRMIGQVEEAFASSPEGPVALIGSSLGAFVAWHVAARQHNGDEPPSHPVVRLVLLAPALDFGRSPMAGLDADALRQWRDTGWREFMHYAYGEPRRVHYRLYEDALQYDSSRVPVTVPALVFQGSQDTLVDPAAVRAFVEARPSMTLCELDDDHQLLGSLEIIWAETASFLGVSEP
jgi:pimeloyl-ACP methyl ester carboxylesterase